MITVDVTGPAGRARSAIRWCCGARSAGRGGRRARGHDPLRTALRRQPARAARDRLSASAGAWPTRRARLCGAEARRGQLSKNPILTPASCMTSLSCSLRACGPIGDAVDEREVAFLAALDVHDVEAVGAARDRRDLHARAAERRQRLDQLELAAGELAGQHLQLRACGSTPFGNDGDAAPPPVRAAGAARCSAAAALGEPPSASRRRAG